MKFKIFFTFLLTYLFLFTQVFAEILFSEILPNTDDDTNLEYIELYNSGTLEQSLSGFILKDKSEKEFIFGSGNILLSNEKKKYFRTETKILLNNSNEELFLFDNLLNLEDSFSYSSSVNNEVISIINEGNLVENNNIGNSDEEEAIVDKGIIIVSDINDIPEIIFSFQSPSYLIEKDKIISEYNCDTSKEGCKINIDFRNSFVGDFSESDFECITDFGFITGEENKCNPSTISIPLGKYNFKIKISDNNNVENFKEKSINIINRGYIPFIKSSGSSGKKNMGVPPIVILKPKIIIQSGLDNDNKCSNKNNCNINFRYAEKSKFEKCKWDFGGGLYDGGINTKCNPGHIKYGTGEYIVNLRVYEKGDYNNFKESIIVFGEKEKNTEIINLEEEREDINIKNNPILNSFPLQEKEAAVNNQIDDNNKLELDNINSVIILQGKIGKNKTINGNILTCYENCSVNFDGSLSGGNIKRYSWDFGNGERYEGKNPGYIKYENPGNYKIYLLAEGKDGGMDVGEFYINFIDSTEEGNEEGVSVLGSVYADEEKPRTGILSPGQEKEAAINSYDKEKNTNKDTETVVILLYVLIFIFGIILVVLLLRKESLL